ncbi:MAG: leucine-rich repeat domain-containing protein [Prevotella sp.]|nr:leucine-rich repeat domain-containing protein [Prevotella sp.]
MKKLFLLALLLFGIMRVWAYKWTNSDGVTWTFTITGSNATIYGADFTYGDVVIPSKVYYNSSAYKVIGIGDDAFLQCADITGVTIPEGVTSIGKRAFKDCSSLTRIIIPSSVTNIGASAFFCCFNLRKVIVPDITAWCNIIFGFDDDYNNPAYDINTDDKNAKFYASPLFYSHHLFSDENTEIIDLVIPGNVNSVNWGTFYGCTEVQSVTISEGVINVAWYSFADCSKLSTITLPSTVSFLDDGAFQYCPNLKKVYVYKETPISIYHDTFSNYENAQLNVPIGCKGAYEAAEYWQDFYEIVEISSLDIKWINSEEGSCVSNMENGVWYTLDGRMLSSKPIQDGIYIINRKKQMVK